MITSNLTDIGQSHRNVLDTIIRFSHLSGECYALNATIAKEVGLSISRISHIISDLARVGYVKVRLEYYPNSKQVMRRSVLVLQRDARGNANLDKEQSESVNNKKNNQNKSESVWAESFNEAVNFGVSPMLLVRLATQYGKEYVAEKVAMLLSSKSLIKNVVGWLTDACKKNWKAATHKASGKIPHVKHIIVDIPKVSSHVDPNSEFLGLLSPTLRSKVLSFNA